MRSETVLPLFPRPAQSQRATVLRGGGAARVLESQGLSQVTFTKLTQVRVHAEIYLLSIKTFLLQSLLASFEVCFGFSTSLVPTVAKRGVQSARVGDKGKTSEGRRGDEEECELFLLGLQVR